MNQEVIIVVSIFVALSVILRIVKRQADKIRVLKIISNDQDFIEDQYQIKKVESNKKSSKIIPFFGSAIALLISIFSGQQNILNLIIAALTGYGIVSMVFCVINESRIRRSKEEVEFYLPVFMEQIVMGVQAGLDVVPAIEEALIGGAAGNGKLRAMLEDTISLSEKGVPFSQALDYVSSTIDIPTVRHAFIHLKLAFSQGGELVRPLRELSDSTQLQYQESVEEEIAKLPVKAVMPLVLTFAGLMICFLTVPIVQLSSIMKSVAPKEISK